MRFLPERLHFGSSYKLDIAVANRGPGAAISLLVGDGTGTFASEVQYAAGPDATSLTAGDFNGDGKLDLAVTGGSGDLNVLLNTGSGAFGAPTDQAVGAMPIAVATGDFNGDGNLDLAVANSLDNNVSVLLGSGTGAFAVAVSYAAGTGPASIATADVNGDTKLDLVVANKGSNDVSVLLGTGAGTFGAAASFAAGAGPVSVTIADLNRDGRPDLTVANAALDTVSVLLGAGGDTFGTAASYAIGKGPASVITGDLDGDGMLDLAVANSRACGQLSMPSGQLCASIAVLLGSGDGTFAAVVIYPPGVGPSGDMWTADFDGDDNLDLAGVNGGTVSVSLGSGTGVFGAPASYGVAAFPTVVTSITDGDFNGDGKLDIVVGTTMLLLFDGLTATGGTVLLLNNGDGTFGAATDIAGPAANLVAGDFDGNGTLDLVLVDGPRSGSSFVRMRVLLGTGTGAFMPLPPSNPVPRLWVTSVADYDGDGKVDLVTTDGLMRGNGDGTFGSALRIPGDGLATGAVDFNGDGKPDLVGLDRLNNRALVVLNTGDGTFGDAIDYPVGPNPVSVGIGDVNGDHSPDLIVANHGSVTNDGSDTVSVLINDGLGSFAAAVNYPVGDSQFGIAVGDFDHDGRLDIAAKTGDSGNLTILFNRGCR